VGFGESVVSKRFANPLLLVWLVALFGRTEAEGTRPVTGPAPPILPPSWSRFQSRHGDWKATWKQGATLPHLAHGPSIRLAGFRDVADGADHAVRSFVRDHADLFGDPTLERTSAVRRGRVWYLSYRRALADPPVPFQAWEFRVSTGGRLMAFRVDDDASEPLPERPTLRHVVSGTVTAAIHPELPSETLVERPIANAWVSAGGDTVATDAAGRFTLDPGAGPFGLVSELRGPWCDVDRMDDVPDALWTRSVADPSDSEVIWNDLNSIAAERDVFYHVNVAHDWLKRIDRDFTGVDYAMPVRINLGGVCDAAWDGRMLYFFSDGIQCPALASMSDIIYHEYGHAWTDRLYIQLGQSWGMRNDVLHESYADLLSCLVRDDPVVGKDVDGPGTILRRIDTARSWPADRGSPRENSLVLSNAFWALRQALGLETASRLAHFALYGKPDAFLNHAEAMAELFVELLVADDDNGNLADGTPHDDTIHSVFNARGLGSGLFLNVQQSEPLDLPSGGPSSISAMITTSSPVGAVAGADLFWSLDGGLYESTPMTTSGGGAYFAMLPAPRGHIVRYYVRARDSMGGARTDPPIEVGQSNVVLAGEATVLQREGAELPTGWTVGEVSDHASGGIWTWGDPNGTTVGVAMQVQPEADHGWDGIMCFFTGQAMVGSMVDANDVDRGVTTLRSPVLDASAAGDRAVIEYWRWFTNDFQTLAVDDRWRTWISNDDGATWVPVEEAAFSQNSWRRVAFFVRDYVTPNDRILLRFQAEDVGVASLVEAAVDDIHVYRLEPPVAPPEPPAPPQENAFSMVPSPNPFTNWTRLRLMLPRDGQVEVTLLDLQGRLVRTLWRGHLPVGPHAQDWNGLDDAGRPVPNGLYLARLSLEGETLVRRVVLAR
jgi:hypothetical protein